MTSVVFEYGGELPRENLGERKNPITISEIGLYV